MPLKATREDIELHYNGAVLDSEGHYRRWSGWTAQHFMLIN